MPTLRVLLSTVDAAVAAATTSLRLRTRDGQDADAAQVEVEQLAFAATEARAATAVAEALGAVDAALAAAAATLQATRAVRRLDELRAELGLADAVVAAAVAAARAARPLACADALCALGRAVAERGGARAWPDDELHAEVRASARQFTEREVAPHAERIHHHDELVPERVITEMGRMGYFGLSIPEAYGGHALGNLAMVLTTEELSRGSLAGGGSLITRPEILAKALLAGGTPAQKEAWLPRIAAGEVMVGISVTEPDVGSDVAAVACRAEPATVGGEAGWRLTGNKAWCTFAGRADVLAVLARTDPDPGKGARGLSLFIVDKPRALGHDLSVEQAGGGRLTGKADRTLGYRGMHSFTLAFDGYFVPAAQLVGGEAGLGRGFHLQMAGFAAGRLQTGGRAGGVMAAAVERAARYAGERRQFGRPIAAYALTQRDLGWMEAQLAACRALTYAAAVAMDGDERAAAPLAAQAKLLACDAAVAVTQRAQVLHGGWGYAEEYPISRLVVDALVLPIFEGVRPVLALKVVGRALLAGAGG
ncbi:MAG: acyl-CoA/acyl-ACP dehydrogenase [Kofleriaceae bacterium]|nr:acyl-CoA/acyl-ACP dehydrogenase [Kofleriaceae bacterium]